MAHKTDIDIEKPKLSTNTLSWHIVEFELRYSRLRRSLQILLSTDTRKSLSQDSNGLFEDLKEQFIDCLKSHVRPSIKRFLIICNKPSSSLSSSCEVEVMFEQLVLFLRQFPPSMTAQKRDVFGSGTNKIIVEFEG